MSIDLNDVRIGAKVVLRDDLCEMNEGDKFYYTPEVEKLKGKVLTISNICKFITMVDVEENPHVGIDLDWLEKFVPYKVGDKVTLKKNVEDVEGLMAWGSTGGKEVTIEKFDEEDNTYLCDDNTWIAHEWIKKLVKRNGEEEIVKDNELKFKVGDIVKVKKSVAHKTKFGRCNIVNDMREFAGKKVEITKVIDGTGVYEGEVRYKIKGCKYNFTSDMFKDKTYNEEDEKYRFKIGDKVRVLENLEDVKDIAKVSVIDDMVDMEGGIYTVLKMGEFRGHAIYNIGHESGDDYSLWSFGEDMLEPVVSEDEKPMFKVGYRALINGNTIDKNKRHYFDIGDKVRIVELEDDIHYVCVNEDGLSQIVSDKYLELYDEEDCSHNEEEIEEKVNDNNDRDEFVSWVIENADSMRFEERDDVYACILKYGDLELISSTPLGTVKMCEEAGFDRSEVDESLLSKMADNFVFAETYIKILKENNLNKRFEEEVTEEE